MGRMYGLFRRETTENGRPRYVQVDTRMYPKSIAVHVFQNRLISEGLSLRPVGGKGSSVPEHIAGMCERCAAHLHTACLRGDCKCNCRMFNH